MRPYQEYKSDDLKLTLLSTSKVFNSQKVLKFVQNKKSPFWPEDNIITTFL